MKIIDLLNKIIDGEEVPKKVLYDENKYSFVRRNRLFAKYIREPFDARVPYYLFTDILSIYDEVEPLEEPKGIPKKLYHCCMETDNEETKFLIKNMNDLVDRYNELLDYLESKGE